MQRIWIIGIVTFAVLLAGCAPRQEAVSVQLVADNPIGNVLTPNVIFVTPTQAPTLIPTIELITPSPTATRTPMPTPTPDEGVLQAACQATLTQLYTQASEVCLGKPAGYVCNGGSAPRVDPDGAIANTLASAGAVVDASLINALHPTGLLTDNGGGIVYMRLNEGVTMQALLIGDVEMRDNTPTGFPKWKNFTVQTTPATSTCTGAPSSAFVLQGAYGQQTSLVVNGVSTDLNGTVIVLTDGDITHFISLEGLVRLIINGVAYRLNAGEQLDVTYQAGDYRNPVAATGDPQPLTWALIRDLPVVIMDRPVLLPQPGYVETTGNVNMRTAPDENSQLLFQVPAGQILDVLGRNTASDWYHVRLGNGETGWMRVDLLASRLGDIVTVYNETPMPPQRFGTLGNQAVVVAPQGGNLRQGPDTYFTTLTTLEQGTSLELRARSPYSPWVKVRAGDAEGWLALITLETQSVIAFLPIDYQAPLPPQPTSIPVFQFGGGHAYPDPKAGQ